MDKSEKLLQCIQDGNFDEAKAVAFQMLQIDDVESIKKVLNEASEYKDTVTYKIVEKMMKYM